MYNLIISYYVNIWIWIYYMLFPPSFLPFFPSFLSFLLSFFPSFLHYFLLSVFPSFLLYFFNIFWLLIRNSFFDPEYFFWCIFFWPLSLFTPRNVWILLGLLGCPTLDRPCQERTMAIKQGWLDTAVLGWNPSVPRLVSPVTLWWTNILLWKDPPLFMGKSTISMAIFNSYVSSPPVTVFCVCGNAKKCKGQKKNHPQACISSLSAIHKVVHIVPQTRVNDFVMFCFEANVGLALAFASNL